MDEKAERLTLKGEVALKLLLQDLETSRSLSGAAAIDQALAGAELFLSKARECGGVESVPRETVEFIQLNRSGR